MRYANHLKNCFYLFYASDAFSFVNNTIKIRVQRVFILLESGYCGVINIENNSIVEEMYSTCSQVVIIYFLHKLAVYLDYAFYD